MCEPNQDRDFRRSEWEVQPVPLKEARTLVIEHHYARGCANTAVYSHGLYNRANGGLYGIALWMPPTRVAAESVNREDWKKVLSLSRLVVLPQVPTNGASFLMSASMRIIRKDRRFVSLVTYADESQGHTGAIYRAANWTYVGRTGPYPRWIDPQTGQQVARLATKSRTKATMLELGYVEQGAFFKHKFVVHF
jgi:hypothetical protein